MSLWRIYFARGDCESKRAIKQTKKKKKKKEEEEEEEEKEVTISIDSHN
jgi:hypothetical protein